MAPIQDDPIKVYILGQEYLVKSEEGEDHVRKVASYVNEQIENIIETTKTVTTFKVAILAAMRIADEYFKEMEKSKRLVDFVENRSKNLLSKIERQV
jgi:cell division protein ZapA